ncbi:hypothetical protein KSC_035870 [Ktedonobacter sp. SOSP1-52]|uniref:zinc ribbon domain-containing protein n=1 Tax=Ktedonobacter sp. SOSP1-52 TaxID=2778366 RepID=UPI001916255E|nr:zinc-ribbon domain-containing protein [Ktedonobacter sp. SOSP1-52]GHO64695.1 hypothetical protein KSC_035870 [Ktedonobacter sp. SOSP1-52]
MRCSRCGNEVSQEEVYCGQCGAAVRSSATRLTNSNPSHANHDTYHTQLPFESNPSQPLRSGLLSQSGLRPTPLPSTPNSASESGIPYPPGTGALPSPGQQQQTGFYRDATEAMSALPGQEYQQPVPHTPMFLSGQPAAPNPTQSYPGSHPSQFRQQNSTHLGGTSSPGGYPEPRSGGSYGNQTQFNPTPALPPRTGNNNTPLFIALACAGLVLVCIVGLIAVFANQGAHPGPSAQVTATATKAPTPKPTPSPTPSPMPSPTPAVTVTPPPNPGFAWCDAQCKAFSFATQYPAGWSVTPAANAAGIQFTNPGAPDQFTSYKSAQATASSASDMAGADLQTNFGAKAGYTPPSSISATTIGGETWVQAIAYYQSDQNPAARERVVVYSTNHNGKNYIIEQQAQDDLFDALNGQAFAPMLSTFQFANPPAA